MKTETLEEAISLLFNRISTGRACIFTQEAMTGCVAIEYDSLGKSGREETYKRIAEDFKRRTGCYGKNHLSFNVGSILEIGCGSGLLTTELAQQTNSDKIIGLDISGYMINLAQSNLSRKSKEEIEKIKEFWERLPEYCKPSQGDYEKLERNPPIFNRIRFVMGSVYSLQDAGFQNINYIVCRNALHRFQYPERALKQMHQALSPTGKIYIRDLRRNANWKTVMERIGEKRWQTQTLVEDYIGAMASMLTTDELEKALHSLGITSFEISDGRYISDGIKSPDNIKEYEQDTEYVCIIQK
ncbi:MAG: methyltransferase domain-containing protein [Nanoarchaeota archaeon]|nr:methyltransferase domain-containing protein [Nanoarchaeota archaeon]